MTSAWMGQASEVFGLFFSPQENNFTHSTHFQSAAVSTTAETNEHFTTTRDASPGNSTQISHLRCLECFCNVITTTMSSTLGSAYLKADITSFFIPFCYMDHIIWGPATEHWSQHLLCNRPLLAKMWWWKRQVMHLLSANHKWPVSEFKAIWANSSFLTIHYPLLWLSIFTITTTKENIRVLPCCLLSLEYRLMPPYLHKHSTTQRRNLKAALPPTTNRTKATWKNSQWEVNRALPMYREESFRLTWSSM